MGEESTKDTASPLEGRMSSMAINKEINSVQPSAIEAVFSSDGNPVSHLATSPKAPSSTQSVSELLERDNWRTRTRYLELPIDHQVNLSSSSSSSSSSLGEPSPLVQADVVYSSLDRYGFINIPTVDTHSDSERKKKLDEREANRSMKWLDMLAVLQPSPVADWPDKHEKFASRLAKGIPDCIRCQVWPLFAESKLPKHEASAEGYRDLYLRVSGYERQIDLDIERTLRDHVMFKIRFSSAQVSLFKILVAYSNYDREVGYCQGMSTIAAFILLYLPEDTAFSALIGVMKETRELFISGFPKLFETFYIQDRLMAKYLPRLQSHLEQLGIKPTIYATKWYLTLFLGFPFALATRIWDLFLFYGFDILPCVSVAILRLSERRIIGCEYEPAMQFMAKLPEEYIRSGQVIRIAVRLFADVQSTEKHRHFKKYREEYAAHINK